MRWMTGALVLLVGLSACAKHKCKLESKETKAAFSDVAEMTKGAYRCEVEGVSLSLSTSSHDVTCEPGSSASCAPLMRAIHPNTSVAAVATQYQTFLEAKQWKVEKKPYTGTRANGKSFDGMELHAEKGDRFMNTTIYQLADTLTEATTIHADKLKSPSGSAATKP